MERHHAVTADHVWRAVTDALLAGLTHDLNGRAAALQGLLHVIALGGAGEQVMSLLRDEGERLEQTVALLRRYPRGPGHGLEAFDPREAAEAALALHARREDHEEVPVAYAAAPDAPAVRADRIATVRALLVLLARAGVPNLGGCRGGVQLAVTGAGADALLAFRAPDLPGQVDDDPYLRAGGELVEEAGGVLRLAPGLWVIALPAVPA